MSARSQDDEKLMRRFLLPDAPVSLSDLIFAKIKEAEEVKAASADPHAETVTPKVVEVFTKVG